MNLTSKKSAVKTSASLTPAQLEHFAQKVRSDLSEATEDSSTPDKALDKTYKRYRRSLEFWVGGIKPAYRSASLKFRSCFIFHRFKSPEVILSTLGDPLIGR